MVQVRVEPARALLARKVLLQLLAAATHAAARCRRWIAATSFTGTTLLSRTQMSPGAARGRPRTDSARSGRAPHHREV